MCGKRRLAFLLLLSAVLSPAAFGAATIVIQNGDPAGVGFNDPTVAAPVGGNTGTTLGQQRLIAFQAAATKWGSTLTSGVTIVIRAQWTALTCTATSAVLGSAGATEIFRDFPGAPVALHWYPKALANEITGTDLDAATPDINANFNVNLGQLGCLTGVFFYLGLDANHGANIDLVTVLEHEFAHGLGFQTFTSVSTGAQINDGTGPKPSIWDDFLLDTATGKTWTIMTDAERVTSAINSRKVVWSGANVTAAVPGVLSLGMPFLRVNSPAGIAGFYDVGTAAFGPALTSGGVTGSVIQALDPADVAGPATTDACSPLTNAGAIAGHIALVDRGTCGFTVKVKNAQNAGATAVLVANNVAGGPPAGLGGADPTITIPSVLITQADGNTLKANLGTGVNATLLLDLTVRAGADPVGGRALLYTPNPVQVGSTISHWDTSASPNQLMEPAINGDLTHEVSPPNDLTFPLLKDIGWSSSAASADLSITNAASAGTITGGTNVTYTLVAANGGPSQADSVTVTYNLPSPLSFVSCLATNGGVCGGSGNNRTVTYASIASAASSTITMVAALPCSAAHGSVVSGTASIASAVTPDPVSSNNSATAVFTVNGALAAPAVTAPGTVGALSPNRTASVPSNPGSTYAWTIANGTITAGQGTSRITFTAGTPGTLTLGVTETGATGCVSAPGGATITVAPLGSAVQFYAVTPCRLVDTRNANGPVGGPVLGASGSADRTFPLTSLCGVPAGATALSVNMTVVGASAGGFLAVYRGDGTLPGTSSISFKTGQVRANNALLQLALDGSGTVKVHNSAAGTVHFVLDVNGFFR